jgi:thiol-disulfide isomerase/thioredoxin
MTIPLRVTGLLLGGLLVLTACGGSSASTTETAKAAEASSAPDTSKKETSDQAAAEEGPDEDTSDEAVSAGSYVDYAEFDADRSAYADGKVVLFFHAGWCPTCKKAEKNLTADPASIPAGLTIVKVDYDTATDLRREYGVTQQHTFVSIAADGSKQKVFTGAVTATAIAERA